MTPSNTHPGTAARGLRRAFLPQIASGLLTARARRRLADRVRARPRLEGLEDRCVLSPAISEFSVPTAGAHPYEITAGPDGNLWFTDSSTNSVGMINPATDAIAEFPVPTPGAIPHGITAGPDGNLWFTETITDKIGMINPATHAITEFPVPTASASPFGIAAGPDGNLWFTEQSADQIGMINPTTHVIAEFPIPTANADPNWMYVGPDGNLWFTMTSGGNIGMINPATHAITEFGVGVTTEGITAGPDGNIWFLEPFAHQIGMINLATHAISDFSVPTANAIFGGITAGPGGNLWFTEESAAQIGTINPATQVVTEYPVPYTNNLPRGITTGPDGNVWFADGNGSIGLAALATTSLVVTQQPPTSVTAGSGFGLTVEAEDSSGHLVTSFNGTVTVVLPDYPGGATLGGTLTVTASDGVATFSALTLNKGGSGYTLRVSGSGLSSAITNAINVTRIGTSSALAVTTTTSPPDPLLAPLVLDSPDLWDGLGFQKRSHLV